MKLAVFGSTGRTGSAVLEQAVAAGHRVTVLVRNPSRLTVISECLKVIHGGAADPAAVEKAVQGSDAVISAMSSSADQKIAQNKPLARGTRNIINAMKKHGVRRLILTAPNSIPQMGDMPDIRFKLLNKIVKFLLPATYDDSAGSVEEVKSSNLDWTIIRMGRAAYAPPTGRVQSGCLNKSMGIRITRADAAAFILSETLERKYIRQTPAICSLKKN